MDIAASTALIDTIAESNLAFHKQKISVGEINTPPPVLTSPRGYPKAVRRSLVTTGPLGNLEVCDLKSPLTTSSRPTTAVISPVYLSDNHRRAQSAKGIWRTQSPVTTEAHNKPFLSQVEPHNKPFLSRIAHKLRPGSRNYPVNNHHPPAETNQGKSFWHPSSGNSKSRGKSPNFDSAVRKSVTEQHRSDYHNPQELKRYGGGPNTESKQITDSIPNQPADQVQFSKQPCFSRTNQGFWSSGLESRKYLPDYQRGESKAVQPKTEAGGNYGGEPRSRQQQTPNAVQLHRNSDSSRNNEPNKSEKVEEHPGPYNTHELVRGEIPSRRNAVKQETDLSEAIVGEFGSMPPGAATVATSSARSPNPEIRVGPGFRVGRKIGSGSFGEIYMGINIRTGEEVGIKLESVRRRNPHLLYECKLYKLLAGGVGIPNIHWYGVEGEYIVMVLDLLGPSLEDLFTYCGRIFAMKTTLMLAEQMLDRIEYVHSIGIIHRDIKPHNFLIGRSKTRTQEIVYIIDFGLAKKYKDLRSGTHIPFRQGKSLTGTAR